MRYFTGPWRKSYINLEKSPDCIQKFKVRNLSIKLLVLTSLLSAGPRVPTPLPIPAYIVISVTYLVNFPKRVYVATNPEDFLLTSKEAVVKPVRGMESKKLRCIFFPMSM